MIEARRGIGWGDPLSRGSLSFGEGGFEFVGNPRTPEKHWAGLAAAIPEERRSAMKRLAFLP